MGRKDETTASCFMSRLTISSPASSARSVSPMVSVPRMISASRLDILSRSSGVLMPASTISFFTPASSSRRGISGFPWTMPSRSAT